MLDLSMQINSHRPRKPINEYEVSSILSSCTFQ